MADGNEGRAIARLRFALDLIERHVPALLLAGIVLVFLLQIVCRYFFRALPWPEEMVGFFFLWLVCFGVGYAERQDRLIRFDMLYERLSPKAQRVLDVIGYSVLVVALAALVVPSIQYISYMNFRSSFVLPIKMSIVYAPFMVLLTALILRYGIRVIEEIAALRAGPPYPDRGRQGHSEDALQKEIEL